MKKERNWDYLRAVILKPEHASEPPGRLVKTQIAMPAPEVSVAVVLGGAGKALTSS